MFMQVGLHCHLGADRNKEPATTYLAVERGPGDNFRFQLNQRCIF